MPEIQQFFLEMIGRVDWSDLNDRCSNCGMISKFYDEQIYYIVFITRFLQNFRLGNDPCVPLSTKSTCLHAQIKYARLTLALKKGPHLN